MVRNIVKDIFDAPIEGLIHQANCHCTMGSGIAKTIRERYPTAYEADCKTKPGDLSKLGTFSYAQVDARPHRINYVFNLYGQGDFGSGKRFTSYDALDVGFRAIRLRALAMGLKTLGIPFMMGSDRGGGNWFVVRAIFEDIFYHDTNLELVVCELPK